MKTIQFFVVILAGIALGGLVGILTRPTVLGMEVPLGILASDSPIDAPFKQALASHLALNVGIGAIAAALVLVLITFAFSRRTNQS